MQPKYLIGLVIVTTLLVLIGAAVNWLYTNTRDSHFAAGRNNGANAENMRVIQTLRRELGDIPDCSLIPNDQRVAKLASSKTSEIHITRTGVGASFCQYR